MFSRTKRSQKGIEAKVQTEERLNNLQRDLDLMVQISFRREGYNA